MRSHAYANTKMIYYQILCFLWIGQETSWIIESGSSSHISNSKEIFTNMTDTVETNIIVMNGNKLMSYNSGKAKIHTETIDGKTKQITIKEVLYIPEIESNILSVSKATQNCCKVIFEKNKCNMTWNSHIILEGKL